MSLNLCAAGSSHGRQNQDCSERGTCFRFNVVFTACKGTSNDGYPVGSFGVPLASRSYASHVILFLTSSERR